MSAHGIIFRFCILAYALCYVACTKREVPNISRPISETNLANTAPSVASINTAQIPNNNFNTWYEVQSGNGANYFELGENASSPKIWSTGNVGAAAWFNLAQQSTPTNDSMPVSRVADESSGFAAQLSTHEINGTTQVLNGKKIVAGIVFTGLFNMQDLVNPYPELGVPFNYEKNPVSFSFKYKYAPAAEVKDGNATALSGQKDSMDAYVILEHREADKVTRLGAGWFRSGNAQATWTTTQPVNIKYATSTTAPADLLPQETRVLKYGADGDKTKTANTQAIALWGDTALLKTTHIIVVFSSSYQGDDFTGAPGSVLTIDDFQLNY